MDHNRMSSGFYKLEGGTLHYGPEYVLSLEYELFWHSKEDYDYPVDGWYWFDSYEEALEFYDDESEPLPDTPEVL